ncbi:DMT family transporter [Levilactobacillus brevis]|nr:DMT family transporter [Levilactobacillus brevis]
MPQWQPYFNLLVRLFCLSDCTKIKKNSGSISRFELDKCIDGNRPYRRIWIKAGSINPEAIAFGLIAAIGVILYTDLPVPLLKQFAAIDVLGWALVIGGATALLGTPLPNLSNFSKIQLLVIAIVVVLSTVVAYDLYLESLKLIDGFLATMPGLFEPISSVFLGILFLHQALVPKILLGILLVIGAIILLNLPSRTPASIPTKIHPCAMTRDHSRIS